jgi:hypothetical protein
MEIGRVLKNIHHIYGGQCAIQTLRLNTKKQMLYVDVIGQDSHMCIIPALSRELKPPTMTRHGDNRIYVQIDLKRSHILLRCYEQECVAHIKENPKRYRRVMDRVTRANMVRIGLIENRKRKRY